MAKGLKCPQCNEVDNYGSTPGAGKGDNEWRRYKKCKVCECIFETLEVIIRIVPPKQPAS